jgi:acyl transferase domain-containing protein
VIGHSVGEYVAACVAGVMTLTDALKLITQRAKLMQSLPAGGTMAAVFADEATLAPILATIGDEQLVIATLNGPENTVIAGPEASVAAVVDQLTALGIRTQGLQVSHGFHSPLMDPILPVFEHLARQVTYHPAQIPLALNVTGELLPQGKTLDAAYWRDHARQPVRFAAGAEGTASTGVPAVFGTGATPHPQRHGTAAVCPGRPGQCVTDANSVVAQPAARARRLDGATAQPGASVGIGTARGLVGL